MDKMFFLRHYGILLSAKSGRRRNRLHRQVRRVSAAGLCFHGDAGGVRRRTDGQGKARALFFREHIDFMVGLPPERHFQSRPVRLQTESVKGRVRKRTFDRTKKASRTEKRKGETDRISPSLGTEESLTRHNF